ncbi:MAG: nucleotidyltransferase family protein [Promethearchaeota archaeon]
MLAAGRGTRLLPLTRETPKPLLPVQGKPILQWIVEGLVGAGFRDLHVVVGFGREKVVESFGDGSGFGAEIRYVRQDVQGGTGDAVNLVRDDERFLATPFVVTYGDILCNYGVYRELGRLLEGGSEFALVVNRVEDPWAGAAVYFSAEPGAEPGGGNSFVEKIVEKPPKGTSTSKWNNSGVYLLSRPVFDWISRTPVSARGELELTQAIGLGIAGGARFRVVRVPPGDGFWCDVGTPPVYRWLNENGGWLEKLLT